MKLIWRQNPSIDYVVFAFKPGAELRGETRLVKRVPKKMREVCMRLLSIDGSDVVCYLEGPFGFLHPLVWEAGALIKPAKFKLKRGEPNDCFDNCMALLASSPTKYRLGIGWALDDEVWRPHAWIMDAKDNLIETTDRRGKYYGVAVSAKELVERMEMSVGPKPTKGRGKK